MVQSHMKMYTFYSKQITFFLPLLFVGFQHRIFSGLYLTDEAPLDHYNHGMKSLSHILLYDVVLGNNKSDPVHPQCSL